MANSPPRAKSWKPAPKDAEHNKDDIIYSAKWGKIRAQYREHHSICERHHIYPRNSYPDRAFDMDNLLTLCGQCHHGYFDKLERANLDQAMTEGRQIKANRLVLGHKVALIGNVNSGKSAIIKALRVKYPSHKVIAIDDYRRLTGDGSRLQEQSAQHRFIHAIKNAKNCIVVMVGYGRLWQQVSELLNTTVLVKCDYNVCYERYTNTGQRVPVPIDWSGELICRSNLMKVEDYHSALCVDVVLNTTACKMTEDFTMLGETVNLFV
jgi:hypothetical protein